MIFKNKLLSSPYDLDQNKVETFSLTSLSKEIYNITQTIYGLYKSGEVIKVENGSKELYLDAGAIDDTVWFRSVPEIREILYRNRKSDGSYPIQFSLNKFCVKERVLFDNLGLEESDEFLKYKQYIKEGNKCRCANYIYNCRNTCKLIDLYGRFVCEKDDTPGIVCFDLDKLRVGFSGEEIQV